MSRRQGGEATGDVALIDSINADRRIVRKDDVLRDLTVLMVIEHSDSRRCCRPWHIPVRPALFVVE